MDRKGVSGGRIASRASGLTLLFTSIAFIVAGCAAGRGYPSDAVVRLDADVQRAMTRCWLETTMECRRRAAGYTLVSTAEDPCVDRLRTMGFCMTRAGVPSNAISWRMRRDAGTLSPIRQRDVGRHAKGAVVPPGAVNAVVPERALVIRVRRDGRRWLKVMTEERFEDCTVLRGDVPLERGCRLFD